MRGLGVQGLGDHQQVKRRRSWGLGFGEQGDEGCWLMVLKFWAWILGIRSVSSQVGQGISPWRKRAVQHDGSGRWVSISTIPKMIHNSGSFLGSILNN